MTNARRVLFVTTCVLATLVLVRHGLVNSWGIILLTFVFPQSVDFFAKSIGRRLRCDDFHEHAKIAGYVSVLILLSMWLKPEILGRLFSTPGAGFIAIGLGLLLVLIPYLYSFLMCFIRRRTGLSN